MVKRFLMSLFTLFMCTLLTFFVIRMIPGNPVDAAARAFMMNEGLEKDVAYTRATAALNYDPGQNLIEAFTDYFGGILRGDFGESLSYRKPVLSIITETLPWTLSVVILALSIASAVGILLGMRIAWSRKKWMASSLNAYGSIFGSIPEYIIAYILLACFSVSLGWFPLKGAYNAELVEPGFNLPFIMDALYHIFLPMLTYFVTSVAGWAIGMRASAASVLGSDYTTYAVARGLPAKRIAYMYVGRNAILPMVTNIVITFAAMLGGIGLVEGVFGYPGMGAFFISSIGARDYALMQGLFLLTSLAVVMFSYIAEFIYRAVDPRMRSIKL